MGFFFLLSLNFYLRGQKSLSIGTFILACLAKVTAVMLPVILLLWDWKHERRNFQEKIPYFLISLLFIIIALFGKAGSHGLWWEKVLIGSKATMFYLQKLFWPTGLSVLYPYTQKIELSNPDLLIPLVLVLLLTILPLSLALPRGGRECWKEFLFGWLFFLLLLAPSFTNFAKGQDLLKDVYFASDRYAYLASIGIIYMVVLFLYALRDVPPCLHAEVRRSGTQACHGEPCRTITAGLLRVTQWVSVCVVLALFFLSYHQSLVWRTTESLFTNVVQQYPDSHVAHNNLGSLFYRRGEIDHAIEKYKDSLAVRPNVAAFFNLGIIYMDNGYPAIAREAFLQVLKLSPGDMEAREKLQALGE